MQPAHVADPRDAAAGREIVPPRVAQANRAARDRFAQLARDVDSREGFQLQRVAEEEDVARGGAPRFGGRRARMVEQHARARRVDAEDADARIRREAKLGVADGDGLAQARRKRSPTQASMASRSVLSTTSASRFSPSWPRYQSGVRVARGRAASRASAVLMICSDTRVAMISRDVGDLVDVQHGDGDGALAQRRDGDRFLEAAQEAAAIELQLPMLAGGLEPAVARPISAGRITQIARSGPCGVTRTSYCLSRRSEARFDGRAIGDRFARELPYERRRRLGPLQAEEDC